MADVRDLLREAVGSYEPRGDEYAVEHRVERRRRRRRLSSGLVGLGVFVAAGWLVVSALGPVGGPASPASGTYVLSDFRVEPYDDPASGEAEAGRMRVSFATEWSAGGYPGIHRCRLRVVSASGVTIGSRSLELSTLSPEDSRWALVAVNGSAEGATATGGCTSERLDTPRAVSISDVRFGYVEGRLSVVFRVDLPSGRPIGAQACTSAVWDAEGRLLGSVRFAAMFAEGERHVGLGIDEATVRAEAASATVRCAPYVFQGVFPEPEPAGSVDDAPASS